MVSLSCTRYLASSNAIVTIRVGNQEGVLGKGNYEIKDDLRGEGYRWDRDSKVWYATEPAAGFTFAEFQSKAEWSDAADGIEVRFYNYSDKEIGRYHVDNGQWRWVAAYSDTFLIKY